MYQLMTVDEYSAQSKKVTEKVKKTKESKNLAKNIEHKNRPIGASH